MRDKFVNTLLDIAKKDKNVHLITGDLGFGVLRPFWEQLPDQITNCGIAEQNMTGFAVGMALEGKIVFTYSIGNFPTLRTLEQIRNDAAYHEANVKIVCVGGGFVYGSLGMSHHATEDLSIMRSLPNVKVFAPGDLVETETLTRKIYSTEGVCYLRLGRGGEKQIHNENKEINPLKLINIQNGKDVLIISTGAIFEEVIRLNKKLAEINIIPTIYTAPTIKPFDKKTLNEIIKKHKYLVTIEEHNIIGGLYSVIMENVDISNDFKVIPFAIEDKYSSVVGDQKFLRDVYGISSEKIFSKLKDIIDE